jgi:hypothetical protein
MAPMLPRSSPVEPPPVVHEIRPVRPSCPQCAYDLRASVTISGATCPECGANLAFDRLRFRPRSILEHAARVRKPLSIGVLTALTVAGVAIASMSWGIGDWKVVVAATATLVAFTAMLRYVPVKLGRRDRIIIALCATLVAYFGTPLGRGVLVTLLGIWALGWLPQIRHAYSMARRKGLRTMLSRPGTMTSAISTASRNDSSADSRSTDDGRTLPC